MLAGRAANELGVPVVLDPVGVGATTYRTETAQRLLGEVRVTVLRGNAGESATLVGVGTAIFHDPSACMRIVRELEEELARRGVESLADVTGLAHEPSANSRRRLTGNVP